MTNLIPPAGSIAASPLWEAEIVDLAAAGREVGLEFIPRIDEDLEARSPGSDAPLWLAVYDTGKQILLGVGGNAAWAALVVAWASIWRRRRGVVSVIVSQENGTLLVSAEGAPDAVAEILAKVPEILRVQSNLSATSAIAPFNESKDDTTSATTDRAAGDTEAAGGVDHSADL